MTTMDTKEIRLEKLRKIIDEKFDGFAGKCADHLGMKRPQVSRWVTKNAKARQGISDESAREIERAFGYERGWMDGLSPLNASEPHAIPYLVDIQKKSKRELRIESITALLLQTDDEGLAVMLHEAEKIASRHPLAKQTPASCQ